MIRKIFEITDTELSKLSKDTGKSKDELKKLFDKAEKLADDAIKAGKNIKNKYAYARGIFYNMIGKD